MTANIFPTIAISVGTLLHSRHEDALTNYFYAYLFRCDNGETFDLPGLAYQYRGENHNTKIKVQLVGLSPEGKRRFAEGFIAAAPKCYDNERDMGNGLFMCCPWLDSITRIEDYFDGKMSAEHMGVTYAEKNVRLIREIF